jgi:hypothetical protein
MRTAFFVLLCAVASACGGRLAPVDGGSSAPDGVAPVDGSDDSNLADASDDANDASTPVECSYDAAYDGPLCTPPANDLLYASPASVSVAAGSYGAVTFVASGPWASDPTMFMWFVGSTQQLLTNPQVETYGTPQTLIFLVPQSAVGKTFTITVAGHAGNIYRTADVTVNVTTCVPLTAATVCAGYSCGYEPDNCGGLVSCGTCSGHTPYCFLRQCQGTMPTYCPYGDGLGPNNTCVSCAQSRACSNCTGVCLGIQDECICDYPGGVQRHPAGK